MGNKRRLAFQRAGKRGRTVVLQHGFLGSSRYWELQIASLAERFDVIAPDLPGFGDSDGNPAVDSIPAFGRAVVDCLDEAGVGRFMLVGHSMGGAIAQQMALDIGDRIERLVLYGTASSGKLPERFETFEQSIARLKQFGTAAHADRVVPTWFVDGSAHPHYRLCRDAADTLLVEVAVAGQVAISTWDVTDRLGEIKIPTLVISGDRDRSCSPNEAFRLWRSIPGAQLCIVPNCAHCVHLERPDLFDKILIEFLT